MEAVRSRAKIRQVDRSAAYMARYIAKNLRPQASRKCLAALYAIGVAEPIDVSLILTGRRSTQHRSCRCRPQALPHEATSDHP